VLFQLLVRHTRTHHLNARHLRLQHQVVNLALRFCVTAVDRKRARNVRRVALVLSAGIYQQQVPIAKFSIVVDVMKHRRVWTTADDRRVRRTSSAAPAKDLFD
jgi:hypothetical protein